MFPYLVLLRVGFTLPLLLPTARCALTAPFQPYLCPGSKTKSHRRCIFCCTFRRLTPPRRYLALCPMEPGLSSAPPKRCRDCPADFRRRVYASKRVLTSKKRPLNLDNEITDWQRDVACTTIITREMNHHPPAEFFREIPPFIQLFFSVAEDFQEPNRGQIYPPPSPTKPSVQTPACLPYC